ncbi:hypothetical protein ABI59_06925 [Acidobacteria bacterium Mor1]|nr:hypothetical protein ABI59_06925 [Acidobacteria bacterium Mor1]
MTERRPSMSHHSAIRAALVVIVALAATSAAAAGNLSGTWHGELQGVPATLTLEHSADGFLSGEIDAQGYRYMVTGSVTDGRAAGVLVDPQAGGQIPFEVSRNKEGLRLVLVGTNPMSGEKNYIPLVFRAGAPGSGGGATGTAGNAGSVPQQLVGLWRMSDSMTSGDASLATESYLELTADGRFVLGGSRVAGGGAGWGGDTGSGGVEERGLWKAEGQVIHIRGTADQPWVPFARYYTEPGKLMLTTGDGTRQLLYRVR